ncbi:glycosyltransferase family 4 protein [Cellulomonas chengniuliangii]|uniref:Glycosyltransferase family 4 protein n=1 Tax=Cellulomonas chengniuliangii TaxID=2968084 RepID=A0ABY5KXN8_9CELL|nr:glycosyltransferase family 1 protein [Cellulomonas chengniuliangii]MCC2308744.1 glycosyltransferase family 4 protein [Cellulomonas chengniuliangii]UUI74505.1 glycosyltransferase family 4 protein [Cellulomonas chengniuliangii]
MRVLIDATAIPADRGGVGRYVDALLPELAQLDLRLVVAAQAHDVELFTALAPSADVVAAPQAGRGRGARLAWEQTGLARLVRKTGADVVHSPHYTMPWASPAPVVVTLHDATFFSHPQLHSRVKAGFFRSATRVAVRRAAALIVPSRATGDEVRRFVGGDPASFHVAHHGVDQSLFHPVDDGERARVRESLGLGASPYVGFLGTLEPRKNVPALIRGWVRAVQGTPKPPALVLAGGPGWDDEVQPAIDAVPSGLRIIRTGYLPLGDLPGFLSGAEVLAYPSLGEGFGLPVLEAMACGAAVLTTRELSLPEVGGSAVAYCGTGEDEIVEALAGLLADPARRVELARAAVTRADEFTWHASAIAHQRAYEAAATAR